jgi:RNase P/RNase MRP subunit POP5
MRLKHRYIIAQILLNSNYKQNEQITTRDLINAFRDKATTLFGEVGAGEFANHANIKFFDDECLNVFIMRVARDAEVNACFAFTCITAVNTVNVTIRVLNISSTVANCQKDCKSIYESAKQLCSEATIERLDACIQKLEGKEL